MTPSLLKFPSRPAHSTLAAALVLLALAVGLAQAHPGHSLHQSTPAHVLASPYHLAMLAVTGATILLGASWVQRRLPRRLLRWLGVVVLATALLAGFHA